MSLWSRNSEPEPAEVICVLELIDFTRGWGGVSLRGKARKKALDKMAAELSAEGRPFIYRGIRHPALDTPQK